MFAARNWRTIRGQFIKSGIPDPLRQLPDMHAVLDFVEVLWTESMDAKELEEWHREMYREETIDMESGELKAVPAGFDAADELAGFDAFAAMGI
ncbi:DUF7240 domain-containing protein [Nocardia cerradoensis]|uniref:DUF7240 domain-containing protein n=1 Tax=Nocardia cerradoensis TaxID=85688 RepID=UPI003B84A67F